MLPTLLTPEETAKYMSVDVKTVYVWAKEGRIASVKIGRNVRVLADSLAQSIHRGGQVLQESC